MIPEFDLRLDSMRRAMTEVILPAIDPSNKLAQEQASLVVAHITMMLQQWDKIDAYARVCLEDICAVAAALEAAGGAATHAAMARLRHVTTGPFTVLHRSYREALAALEELVRAVEVDGDPAFRRSLHRDVLLHGNRQAARDRAWFAASGFDVNAAELKTIDEILEGV